MKGVGSMSDSVIGIFSIGFLTGMITLAMAFVLWKDNDDADDKGQCELDSDIRVYVPSRDRGRSGYHGCNQFYDPEEVIDGLQYLRMALSQKEKEYLDYACESVLIRHIMIERAKKMKEGSTKDGD